MSTKRTPKTVTRRRNRQQSPIPTQLAALLALIHDQAGSEDAGELARAITAARRALRDPLGGDDYEISDSTWAFIGTEAARGSWANLHAKIEKLTRPEDSDLGAISGDFQNLYGGPALAMGIALAYVYLQEGGAR